VNAKVPPILVLGIGNPLMGDEGVGVRVVEALATGYDFPEAVELVDAGTMGLGMLHVLRDREFVLVVDAVDGTGTPPGTVVRLSPADIAPNQILHSLHDTRFVNVLEAAELAGFAVNAECVGIQILEIRQWVTELTPQVEAAIGTAVGAVLDALAARGIEPVTKSRCDCTARIIESIRTYDDIG
jgi:hydrogenase maturation protease